METCAIFAFKLYKGVVEVDGGVEVALAVGVVDEASGGSCLELSLIDVVDTESLSIGHPNAYKVLGIQDAVGFEEALGAETTVVVEHILIVSHIDKGVFA